MIYKRDFCLKYFAFRFHWGIQILLLHPDNKEQSRVSTHWCRCEFERDPEGRVYFPDNPWIHSDRSYYFRLPCVFKFLNTALFTFAIQKEKVHIFWLFRRN